MRLPDLVNGIRRRASETINVVRHPVATAHRQVRRRLQSWFEGASIPGTEDRKKSQKKLLPGESEPVSSSNGGANAEALYSPSMKPTPATEKRQFSSPALAKRQISSPSSLSLLTNFDDFEEAASRSQYPPLLPPGQNLKGAWWGRYQLQHCLDDGGWVRLYQGAQAGSEESIWVYEYLLPEEVFNSREAAERHDAFQEIVTLNMRQGPSSDFRLLKMKDFVPDNEHQRRCILIAQSIDGGISLQTYLHRYGQMRPSGVKRVLEQVLQSLHYLHAAYLFRSSNAENYQRGMAHGNVSLDSLWMRSEKAFGPANDTFFVYLTRFSLWERYCQPINISQDVSQQELGEFRKDLAALGRVGVDLLTGTPNPQTRINLLKPSEVPNWPQTPEAEALRPFLCRLLGQEEPRFETAEIALAELKKTPRQVALPQIVPEEVEAEEEAKPKQGIVRSLWLWLGFSTLGILGVVFLILKGGDEAQELPVVTNTPPCPKEGCQMSEIAARSTPFKYGVAFNSAWRMAFFRTLEDPSRQGNTNILMQCREAVEKEIEATRFSNRRDPALREIREIAPFHWLLAERALVGNSAQFRLWCQQPNFEGKEARYPIQRMRSEDLNFMLVETSGYEASNLNGGQIVAYDGIVPIVVYSNEYGERSIPAKLNGEITLKKLAQLFGSSKETHEINGATVKLYFPATEDGFGHTTVQTFKELLKKQGLLSAPGEIENFNQNYRRYRADIAQRKRTKKYQNVRTVIHEQMLFDFDDWVKQPNSPEIIGIGFERLSRVVGQCAIYPLTVKHAGQMYSPLVEFDGQAISPSTDLCGDKGAYWQNSTIFKNQYPLGYGLGVMLHPDCPNAKGCESGNTFARLLTTIEGQYLLSQTGLVPRTPIGEIRQFLQPSTSQAP